MTPDRWSRLSEIFGDALEFSGAERTAFVREACADDDILRKEILKLLETHDQPDAFVDRNLPAARLIEEAAAQREHGGAVFRTGEVVSGRFRIERFLGEGGMGEVYEAFDSDLGVRVAIKTLHPQLATSARFADRFRREIQVARQVTHANVCRIFDAGRHGQTLYFTMELLVGETLAQRIGNAKLSIEESRAVIGQLCDGLSAAHTAGIVHRDFKAANVILAGGRAVVTDFGLAKLLEPESDAGPSTALAIGTPAYMAPEQFEGGPTGAAVDIYALGVVLYEMTTGRKPYEGTSPLAVASMIGRQAPLAPHQLADLPAHWSSIILKCLAVDPAQRFVSARAVLEALDEGQPVKLPRRPGAARGEAKFWRLGAVMMLIVAGLWALNALYESRQLPPANVEAWFREGLSALHEGNLATSQRAFLKVTDLAPQWPTGHARLAQVYAEMDQPDLARESILQAIHVKPSFYSGAQLINAIQSLIVRDYLAASAGFRQIAASQSGAARWNSMLDWARSLKQADRAPDALKIAGELLSSTPDSPAANLLRAQLGAVGRDQPEVVQRHFERALEGFQTLGRMEAVAETQLGLSELFQRKGDVTRSREMAGLSLASSLAARSSYSETKALFRLARIATTAGDPAEATMVIQRARDIAKGQHFGGLLVQGFVDLGIQLFTQGKVEMARELFTTAILEADQAHSPFARARAQYWLGRTLARLRKNQEALHQLAQAESFDVANHYPREAMLVRLQMALVWNQTGESEKAAKAIEAVQKDSAETNDRQLRRFALAGVGDYLRSIGDHALALRNYQTWWEIAAAGGNVEDECQARSFVARSLINLGRFTEARHTLAGLSSDKRCRQPHQVTMHSSVEALLLTEEGRVPEALALYRKMRASAIANRDVQNAQNLRGSICFASVLGEPAPKARSECAYLFEDKTDAREAAAFQFTAADLFLHEKSFVEARKRAEEAVQNSLARGNLDDAIYSTLIRGQAEARLRNRRQLAVTLDGLENLKSKLAQRWGAEATDRYLARPLYATRWKEIATALGR